MLDQRQLAILSPQRQRPENLFLLRRPQSHSNHSNLLTMAPKPSHPSPPTTPPRRIQKSQHPPLPSPTQPIPANPCPSPARRQPATTPSNSGTQCRPSVR